MQKCLTIILLLITATVYGQSRDIMTLKNNLPTLTDSLRYIDVLNRLSILYYEENVDTCLSYARSAYDIAQRKQYQKGKADGLTNMGIVYEICDDPDLAFRFYNDALGLYQRLLDSSNIVQLTMNIGLVLQDKGEYAKSLEYLRRALSMGSGLRNDSIMSLVLVDYVSMYTDDIPKDSLTFYMNKATDVATRYHDDRSLIALLQVRGVIELNKGNRDEGIDLLRQAAAGAVLMDASYMRMDIYNELGRQFLSTQPDSALKYYTLGLHISEEKKYNALIKVFSENLYTYYSNKGNTTQALAYAAKLLKIYRDEQTANNRSGVDYVDYAVAERKLDAANARSENRKLLILILGIVSISAIAIAIFVMRLYRLKEKHAVTLEALNTAVGERNEELQQKHEFNNKLVSLLAHDFRQPIITAKGLATLLREPEDFTREELDRIVQSIEVSSDTAIDIFENILQWIKRQLSGFNYEPVPVNLRDLVDQAIRPFIVTGEEKHISFVNAVAETISIRADRELLQFINRNLIHNALKFSPERSSITVSARTTLSEVIVCVADEGKGINPEKLPQLFNFKKELQYDNDKEKGAGIALMICKDFMDRMYGKIWAENRPGKGAMFCYALPVD